MPVRAPAHREHQSAAAVSRPVDQSTRLARSFETRPLIGCRERKHRTSYSGIVQSPLAIMISAYAAVAVEARRVRIGWGALLAAVATGGPRCASELCVQWRRLCLLALGDGPDKENNPAAGEQSHPAASPPSTTAPAPGGPRVRNPANQARGVGVGRYRRARI
jgi:hypothetical protein